ncbi:DUF998 domain-containing protein [Gordonia sp. NPDC003424]
MTGGLVTDTPTVRTRAETALLACGVAAAAVQIVSDVVAATRYSGYSYRDQTVSELSAIGAPTRDLLLVTGWIFEALICAFAVGVWRAAGHRTALRVTAVLLIVFAVNGFVWSFFPMQQRGSEMASTDVMHIVFAVVQVVTIVAFIVAGSGAGGPGFRVFSGVIAAAILLAGAIAGTQAPKIGEGGVTPWIGVIERVSFYGPSVWIVGLAVVLLRATR